MKNNLLKYYIVAIFFCSTTLLLAQGPGDTNGGTGDAALEGADAPATPIDNYIWVLAVIALVYVFLKFRAIQNKKITG
ncbi:MAG: hypothetical protein PHC28_09090 [Flavobacterium sp.]|uniref:hypothetical protein n=1 Tax=Flavobacterium sp. TaxID=239 RepID=UPI00261812CF|nr:hypothetical protein [Flavobacterium sp.]MDD5150623.1 hypothetical protein [Flavobacterium sp.]